MPILVATDGEVIVIDIERSTSVPARGISDRPTCLAADALAHGRAWCGTHRDGVFRTDDGGRSWRSVGLAGRLIMAIAASPVERDGVWVGTEPGGFGTHPHAISLDGARGDGHNQPAGKTDRPPGPSAIVGPEHAVPMRPTPRPSVSERVRGEASRTVAD